jgi:hypothetical protein
VRCTGQGVGAVAEKISKATRQVPIVCAGQDCELYLKLPDASPLDMNAKIMDPDGVSEDIEVSFVLYS